MNTKETPLLDLLLLDFLADHTGPEDDEATQESLLQVWQYLHNYYHAGSRKAHQAQQHSIEVATSELKDITIKAQEAQIKALSSSFDKALNIIEKLMEEIETLKAKQ